MTLAEEAMREENSCMQRLVPKREEHVVQHLRFYILLSQMADHLLRGQFLQEVGTILCPYLRILSKDISSIVIEPPLLIPLRVESGGRHF